MGEQKDERALDERIAAWTRQRTNRRNRAKSIRISLADYSVPAWEDRAANKQW
jgi:hypothetical protein